MRKLLTFILTLAMICSLAVPAMAANEAVVYTSDSSFVAGGTVKVNEQKTKQNIMDLGKNAAEYNAALEGNMQYYWFRNDSYYKDGPSITLTENDKGCQFYCKVYLFSDADRTQQCGTYDGAKFTVPNTGNPALIPEIRDAAIPDGKVGQSYYVKLDCSDPDVVFSLFRSSLPDGLTLSQHGEIEGTPTKAGFWHVVIMVTPEAGEDYANTKEFEITIAEDGSDYTLEIVQAPNKVTYTAGEKLDMTGLQVRIYTPDGFIDSKDGKDLTYSQKELVTVGEQKIKISYKDAFEFFIVTVVAAPTTEPTDPDVTTNPTEPGTTTAPTDPGATTTPNESSKPTEDSGDTSPDAEDPAKTPETTHEATDSSTNNDNKSNNGMPWWGILLIVIAAAGIGIGVAVLVMKKKK